MKKETEDADNLPEYDFSQGVRGRYAGRFFPTGPWNEGDRVVLDRDAPEHRLKEGDIGEVVHRYEGGGAFKVRFQLASGETAAVLTLRAPEIRSLEPEEILQARHRGRMPGALFEDPGIRRRPVSSHPRPAQPGRLLSPGG